MTRGKVDLFDLAAFPVFLLASFAELELLPDLPLLTDVLLDLGEGGQITVAVVLGAAALVTVIVTNKPTLSGWGGAQLWVVVATFLLMLGPSFIPILEIVLRSDIAAGVAVIVQSAGYMVASFMG